MHLMLNYNHTVTADKKAGTVTIEGELDSKDFAIFVSNEIRALVKGSELPGFRKGTAPEKLIIEKIGMDTILYRAAEEAIADLYLTILEKDSIDAIGRPQVAITKLAKDNPLGFKIATSVLPEIDLDHKKIASGKNKERAKNAKPEEVTDKEVEDVVKEVKRSYLARENPEKEATDAEVDAFELTDELIKRFGKFESVADFKAKARENLKHEKEHRAEEKARAELFEALIEGADLKIPPALVEAEQDRMLSRFKHDVSRMGIAWEDYVKHLKKTEEEIKKEWEKDAEEKAAIELILDHVAKKESIAPSKEKIDEEVSHLVSHHPDLERASAESYVKNVLTRGLVVEFLEKIQ